MSSSENSSSSDEDSILNQYYEISSFLKKAKYFQRGIDYDNARRLSKNKDLTRQQRSKLLQRIKAFKRLPDIDQNSDSDSDYYSTTSRKHSSSKNSLVHNNKRPPLSSFSTSDTHVNLDTPTTLGLVADIDDAAVQDDAPDASIAPTDASVAPTGGHGATIADDNDNAPFEV
jgi:hypothetical protein